MTRAQKIEEKFFKMLMLIATTFILAVLALIIYSIFEKGLRSISWEMLTQVPHGGYYYGKGGGILNAILGSLTLAFGATALAFVIGLPVALYLNVFLIRHKKVIDVIRFLLDLVWGIPSIVYGAFGFSLMIFFGLQTSLLSTITILQDPMALTAHTIRQMTVTTRTMTFRMNFAIPRPQPLKIFITANSKQVTWLTRY